MKTGLILISIVSCVWAAACAIQNSDSTGDGSGQSSGSGGAGGSGQSSGSGGEAGSPGQALSPTTFIFRRRIPLDANHSSDGVVAMDYATRQERIVSTLSAETVDGFNIDGMAVSPDRTRIVVASLFGATQADVATGVGGNRLWSMDIYGGDMLRLTPVFTGGPDTTRVDVRNPTFSQDGQRVYYDYGEYSGGSWYVAPWWVPPDGSAKPQLFEIAVERCSINFVAAANPATGDLLVKHTVCIPGTHGGYFLYPRAGGAPVQLVDDALINLSTERPTFSPDGAGFLFTARDANGIQSLYAYLFDTQQISLVIEGTPDMDVVTGVFSPDFSHIVYCVKEKGGGSTDLWALDVSVNPPSNQRLTQDGQSCHPVF